MPPHTHRTLYRDATGAYHGSSLACIPLPYLSLLCFFLSSPFSLFLSLLGSVGWKQNIVIKFTRIQTKQNLGRLLRSMEFLMIVMMNRRPLCDNRIVELGALKESIGSHADDDRHGVTKCINRGSPSSLHSETVCPTHPCKARAHVNVRMLLLCPPLQPHPRNLASLVGRKLAMRRYPVFYTNPRACACIMIMTRHIASVL